MEWQPIETAPRDTMILAGNSREGYTTLANFDHDREEWWEANTHWTDAHSAPLYPTHWMPLPPPPEGET